MKLRLTDTAVKNAKPKPDGKPAKHTDGGGLYLWVTQSAKVWRYDYTRPITGKRNTLVIGNYPETGLRDAREQHQTARDLLARGIDPSEHRKAQEAAERDMMANSFESVALEWLVKFRHTWSDSTYSKITGILRRAVFPWLGARNIATIEPPDVLEVLRRQEAGGKLETAHKARQYIGQICRYAVATGRSTRDPTPDLKGAIPPVINKSYAALTNPQEVGKLMQDIGRYPGRFETRLLLQASAYMFTRPGEVRQMQWAEINPDRSQWLIPAERMKLRQEHIVPLSRQMLALLDEIKPLTGYRQYVFPGRNDPRQPASNSVVRQALIRMGYQPDVMQAHGFRSTASTLLHEELHYPSDVIEKQLAHAVGSKVRRVYDRSQHLPERTRMMQEWADYLDRLMGALAG
ncbi:integrase arm-type DNA-binding domain-containing protein [Candidatus Thiothrix sp. Deng01]|uniref:Integrase arm-type DNA-binding domain-containing protein n=1 Tax=Candidatus Thiothrix phosphatis TaxID=3112415 RepID=A0ABU6CYU1_9GAMM|nr:integrase arm-type DNA-binding domain-containing protein [Candidatus Thiothrix sp. Deng01]MEB4592005.1 integrase arm-type DNA-binding domain-containing protein [Candidatus Thiothrix sp. Deng01]